MRPCERMSRAFSTDPNELVAVSAKTGLNIDAVLAAVVERVEHPSGDGGDAAKLRMLLLDCHYDPYRVRSQVLASVEKITQMHDARSDPRDQNFKSPILVRVTKYFGPRDQNIQPDHVFQCYSYLRLRCSPKSNGCTSK